MRNLCFAARELTELVTGRQGLRRFRRPADRRSYKGGCDREAVMGICRGGGTFGAGGSRGLYQHDVGDFDGRQWQHGGNSSTGGGFLIVIRDIPTGTLLCLGQVADPSSTETSFSNFPFIRWIRSVRVRASQQEPA